MGIIDLKDAQAVRIYKVKKNKELYHKNNAQYRTSVNKRMKKVRSLNPEKFRAAAKKHYLTPVGRINSFLRHARQSGKEFNLDRNDINIPDKCPVFGIALRCDAPSRSWDIPSLDRVDNSKGYIKGNVQVISWRANSLKRDATLEELILLGKYAENKLTLLKEAS